LHPPWLSAGHHLRYKQRDLGVSAVWRAQKHEQAGRMGLSTSQAAELPPSDEQIEVIAGPQLAPRIVELSY
jgi:hypothetical protein